MPRTYETVTDAPAGAVVRVVMTGEPATAWRGPLTLAYRAGGDAQLQHRASPMGYWNIPAHKIARVETAA